MKYTLTEEQKFNKHLIQCYTILAKNYPDKYILDIEVISDFILVYKFSEIVYLHKPIDGSSKYIKQLDKVDLTLTNTFPWKWLKKPKLHLISDIE